MIPVKPATLKMQTSEHGSQKDVILYKLPDVRAHFFGHNLVILKSVYDNTMLYTFSLTKCFSGIHNQRSDFFPYFYERNECNI